MIIHSFALLLKSRFNLRQFCNVALVNATTGKVREQK